MDFHFLNHSCDYNPFFRLNAGGYLMPPLMDKNEIPHYNQLILSRLVSLCKERIGSELVSIYFRGSQLLDSFNSDFDTVVVTNSDGHSSVQLSTYFYQELFGSFPNIKIYDTLMISKSSLMANRSTQFIVKVLAVHIYGENIHREIEDFKPDKSIIFLIPKLNEKLDQLRVHLQKSHTAQELRAIANYFVKFLMRCTFELVIDRFNKYTRDVGVCNRVFNDYYPQYKEPAKNVLRYLNDNSIDAGEFLRDCELLSKLIMNEYRTIKY